MPLDLTRIFPPQWNPGDRWSVAMKTLAVLPDDVPPRFVEYTFDFVVTEVPAGPSSVCRIQGRSADREEAYALYFRPEDSSLEKVTRLDPGAAEEQVIRSGRHPFIYYERRLPIVPDFPVATPVNTGERREFEVAGNRVVQDIRMEGDRARFTLQRIEALGSLRVTMEWLAGDPWWSNIECSENPPPGVPYGGQVVASGRLVQDSIVRAK